MRAIRKPDEFGKLVFLRFGKVIGAVEGRWVKRSLSFSHAADLRNSVVESRDVVPYIICRTHLFVKREL